MSVTRQPKDCGGFPETRWSLLGRAAGDDSPARAAALAQVLDAYLPALRAFLVRGRRLRPDVADDVLQGFVADKILGAGLVGHADPARGRFRNLILRALSNYANTYLRRHRRRAEGLDAVDPPAPGPDVSDAQQREFDQQWLQQVIRQALQAMEEQCRRKNRPDLWEVFRGRVIAPALEDVPPADYAQLVARFQLTSPREVINLLATGKRMFSRCLRAAVGRYADSPQGIEREIDELRQILA